MNREQSIIFLSYLTNYNINEIFHSFTYRSIGEFVEDYLKRNSTDASKSNDKFIQDTLKLASERYEEMRYAGINFISYFNPKYPAQLKPIYQAPPLLYVKGDLAKIHQTHLAIVGTRNPSEYASSIIQGYIDGIDPKKNGIISGLALGIDTIAHSLAIKNKIYTIAVLPNSLDHIYPKENMKLANDILDNSGCLVSEMPIGINRGKKSFVERNRLQTGLSEFIIPVELGINSGTMHTVNFCIKQKRYLLVKVPTKEQQILPSFEGLNFLMNKDYERKVILRESVFNLDQLISHIRPINPTLF